MNTTEVIIRLQPADGNAESVASDMQSEGKSPIHDLLTRVKRVLNFAPSTLHRS